MKVHCTDPEAQYGERERGKGNEFTEEEACRTEMTELLESPGQHTAVALSVLNAAQLRETHS